MSGDEGKPEFPGGAEKDDSKGVPPAGPEHREVEADHDRDVIPAASRPVDDSPFEVRRPSSARDDPVEPLRSAGHARSVAPLTIVI